MGWSRQKLENSLLYLFGALSKNSQYLNTTPQKKKNTLMFMKN